MFFKFFNQRMKNLSRQKISLYAIFRTLDDEELVAHQQNLDLPEDMSDEDREFAKTHTLLTVLTTDKQYDEFLVRYYLDKHQEHYSRWAPLHGYAENPDSQEAMQEYLATAAQSGLEEFEDNIVVTLWRYDANSVAAMFRMFFGCMPMGMENELPMEVDYFTSNLALAVSDALKSFTEDQLTSILQAHGLVPPASTDASADTTTVTEPEAEQTTEVAPASTDAPKKKRGRPRKNPETTPEKGE